MNREEAIKQLNELSSDYSGDTEADHSTADNILCELLSSLGYQDVVDAWEKVNKWYA